LAKRVGFDTDETTISGFVESAREQFLMHFDTFAFNRALEAASGIIMRIDRMITEARPWDLAKDENQRQTLNAVLYRAAETIRWLAVMLYPVMPESTARIYGQLGLTDRIAEIDPAQLKWGGLPEGTQIGEIEPVFPRLDKARIMGEIKTGDEGSGTRATEADVVPGATAAKEIKPGPPMTQATEADAVSSVAGAGPPITASGNTEPSSPGQSSIEGLIEITDFARVELRVGEVLTAERIPKADKLLLLTVDIGEAKPRQILAGIAQYYEPEKMIGRKIAVVANLKPRKLRGYESQGMLLAASVGDEGKPVIATFVEEVPNGARLK